MDQFYFAVAETPFGPIERVVFREEIDKFINSAQCDLDSSMVHILQVVHAFNGALEKGDYVKTVKLSK